MSTKIFVYHTTPDDLVAIAARLQQMWQQRSPQQIVEYTHRDAAGSEWTISFRVDPDRMGEKQ